MASPQEEVPVEVPEANGTNGEPMVTDEIIEAEVNTEGT